MKTKVTNMANSLRFQQLLDEHVALGVLREHVFPDEDILGQPTGLRIERYWPGRDGTLSIEWSFCLNSDLRFSLYGQVLAEDTPQPIAKTTELAPYIHNQTLLGVSVYVVDWHLTIHTPDHDDYLEQLGTFLQDASSIQVHERTEESQVYNRNGNGRHASQTSCHLLGYRAGRRAAVHYSSCQVNGSTDDLFCKIYRDDRGHDLIRRHGHVSDQLHMMTHGRVCVPEPIRYNTQHCMAQFHWIDGHSMSIGNPDFETQLHLSAKALSVFHSIELDDLPTFTLEDELRIVERWMLLMHKIAPHHQQLLEKLAKMLQEESTRIDLNYQATLHRDYYPAQLIINGDRVALLDLDTMAKGPCGVDLGNFLAHLLLECIVHDMSVDDWSMHSKSFIQSYVNKGGSFDSMTLSFYLSSSLIRIGMVHALRNNGDVVAELLWDIAEKLLSDPHSFFIMD